MTNQARHLWEVSKIWCPDIDPDHPRRVSNEVKFQTPCDSRADLVTNLVNATEADRDGYVSTYSFPRGHTDNGQNIPAINTIFVDFDIPKDSEYRTKDRSLDAWKRSMSKLLVRVQAVAQSIIDGGREPYWRASLSGHKGVHLFLDFPEIHHEEGTYTQFKNGLKEFGNEVIENLDDAAGGINIGPWVDVDSSDLARLVRMPNTPNVGAEHVDESWCVPVTIEELTDLTPDEYLELTSSYREVPASMDRNPSSRAGKKLRQKIRNASGAASSSSSYGGSAPNSARLKEYRENANHDINVSDIPLLVGNKPCIMEFVKRDDAYDYGEQSRKMEISVMKELIQKRAPIDVIVNFFRPIPGWEEERTRDTVEDLIQRDYGKLTCKTIWRDAPEFCPAKQGEMGCQIYKQEHGIEKEPQRPSY